MLAAFFALAFLQQKGVLQTPILPALIGISFIITLSFQEALWHRYLCPFGSILELTYRKPLYSVKISTETCTGCGLCERICPVEAIERTENDNKRSPRYIKAELCLTCRRCAEVCPQNAVT